MKQILILVLLFTNLTFLFSQNAVKGTDGNYTAKSASKNDSYKPEGAMFTDKDGKILPVYRSKKGKLFVFKTSKKTGKQYRYYLKF